MALTDLLAEVRACRVCEASLPLGPRPVLQVASTARLLIVSQAPGRKVHQSGVPWDDASGARLREWMMLESSKFYDESRVAILPMGLCYPGASESGGDRPPRRECAGLWHDRLLGHLPDLQLTLLVGQHAQRHYLASRQKASMTETVKAFSDYGPRVFPLPHPSWRSAIWMRKNPWFEQETIPELQRAVRNCMARALQTKHNEVHS
jgi:uracil-DNA glycosylase